MSTIRDLFDELAIQPSDGWAALEGWTLPPSNEHLSPASESLVRSILVPDLGATARRLIGERE